MRRNGLGPLREGSELSGSNFHSYYKGRTDHFLLIFMIIFIVSLVVLFLSQFILVPIVFTVQRTNNKVLSLFGYIPIGEINELAAKAERFIHVFLDDYRNKRDDSYLEEEEEEGHVED